MEGVHGRVLAHLGHPVGEPAGAADRVHRGAHQQAREPRRVERRRGSLRVETLDRDGHRRLPLAVQEGLAQQHLARIGRERNQLPGCCWLARISKLRLVRIRSRRRSGDARPSVPRETGLRGEIRW
jgi:hypothetical protein